MSCGEVNKPWAHRAKARGHVHKQEVRVNVQDSVERDVMDIYSRWWQNTRVLYSSTAYVSSVIPITTYSCTRVLVLPRLSNLAM
jgi:hypothetical protein